MDSILVALIEGVVTLAGVIVANIELLVGVAVLEPTWRALAVALVMAVLSPVMAEIGKAGGAGAAVLERGEGDE